MSDDDTFRAVLLVGLLVIVPIAAYHRIKAHRTGEKLDRRQEGLFILFTLRPMGFAMMAGLVAYIISPSAMAWSSLPLPAWMRWSGVLVGVFAALLLTWTLRSLGTNLTDTVVTRREHTLVTHGPYAWIRHPFYTSLLLVVVANALAAANWFILVTGGLTFALLAIRARREEENLIARFGDRYENYTRRTGRFLPRFDG
jgi:protein-S-isoprenylcysteine O-methyltransferase Ste14